MFYFDYSYIIFVLPALLLSIFSRMERPKYSSSSCCATGAADTAIGAQKSRGGRSIIALYSTAMVKNAAGEREEVSKIVCQLKPGAAVSLSRNDIDWLVTEYGAVCLRGTGLTERAKLIISVAHPKFRDQLLQEAIDIGILTAE